MRWRHVPEAIGDLFTALGNGDPIAWGGVGLFLFIAVALGLFVLKVRRDLAREDAQRKPRWMSK
jgi:hypothetical protein